MRCLNDRAYQILLKEAKRWAKESDAQTQYQIVLKRLNKLNLKRGTPMDREEIRASVIDMFPNFSAKAIAKADRANRSPNILGKLTGGAIAVAGIAGLLWVANLPYPPIRRPVANTAPILLLPSFFNMDRNYRGAIAKVEQADQLINQATSGADIELGEEKTTQAQKHLDALPVWFLGYEPRMYCSLFGCGWKFTLDEFEQARKSIGRMEAKVFQEKNALEQLQQAENSIVQAQQKYQTATGTEKENAIASWRSALQQISLVPQATFAGKQAQQKFTFHRQEFEENVGKFEEVERAETFVDVAKQFAWQAAKASQNPPHSVAKWQQIEGFWQQAIAQLQQVKPEDKNSYIEAQKKVAEYSANLGQVQLKRQEEEASVQALEKAQTQIQQLLAATPDDPARVNRPQTAAKIQGIINELKKVRSGTTVYNEAQELLNFANAKLDQLQ